MDTSKPDVLKHAFDAFISEFGRLSAVIERGTEELQRMEKPCHLVLNVSAPHADMQ